jgi:hypothetical protein
MGSPRLGLSALPGAGAAPSTEEAVSFGNASEHRLEVAMNVAALDPHAAGYYLHWGVVQISLTNFLIIVGMVVLFVLALLLPFPGGSPETSDEESSDERR